MKGARTHNLKNITVEMPRGAMTVITGLSGSGKSSLAFDTIFAEGQRRYVESLSAYARQFLNQMAKPDVDEISGLSPAISIDQKSRSNNPRSTVATVTEIYDYLRVLYARAGQPYCIHHDVPITRLSKEEIIKIIFSKLEARGWNNPNSSTQIPASRVMGVPVDRRSITIYAPVVVGRKGEYYQLLYDLLGKGYERVVVDGKVHSLREKIVMERNKVHSIDAVVDSIYVTEFARSTQSARERLSEALELALKQANGLVKIQHADGTIETLSSKFICPEDGASFPEVEPRLFSFNSPYGACPECHGLGTESLFSDTSCPTCEGKRLRPEALRVYLKSKKDKTLGKSIVDFTNMSIREAKDFVDSIELSEMKFDIAMPILKEIESRLTFMLNVGLDYLTLNRSAATLSGGEAQRIRLASQLGSGLTGALYVLDEPTIGLHQRDNARLIKTLLILKELGNTILVVEHDEDTIYSSDYIVDIGPGAGIHGGEVVASGWLDDLLTAKKNESDSVTLSYLRQEKEIPVPETRRTSEKGWLKVRGATLHNLVNQNIDVPLGKLVCVTGVSGSGKSTFLYDILHRNIAGRFARREAKLEHIASLTGTEYVGRAILIDQSPIGRTPRSNPATYTGAFTHIRDLFAATPEARARGWKPGRFSFNVPGGRCEACQGNGSIAVEMHFLPTVYVTCDICMGKRFMKETLEVTFRGKNIYDVLQMTIEEAEKFFGDIPAINERLMSLNATGLEYLTLGQNATTLSGGEAQRVKIASELYRSQTMKTIYLLDEPTVGLHYEDVKKLIEILQELVRRGNTVVVIEHNLDVIKNSDYVIDFGPDGGAKGGKIVAKGTPEEVAGTEGSHTGEYLDKILKRHKKK
ncbi:excinuclease ABC subunit A [Candidatus Kaiserbacteria bacterium RIFCSPLOWO2_02_FULL_54_13]|uniref:UvrABC system protein A n=1 Tax=Candidatus Kaiserbacteria bacterium RIFCSPHIGHO2_02_FULL_54_22 TaxID=1798495 RepID=A0A1F6DNE9_9BACT|nr:MAG: excinuclease ABC subunit A [Candidatus Kaiserbacteria bacterium RIFCSPHIGHO2_02_FULL_54_22]OGG68105.1 MAG: excinuclease ABC subunit A [Candidatus Kaiserbacteria bacterium RIFCSPHIGHO2_12_FULL_54_16]OGG83540.1 MAG: excinuclease ABC subunit A [Candidatus Kaiserbacteria bacterium RIFCSPLOWO2_02_FULL_54_13]